MLFLISQSKEMMLLKEQWILFEGDNCVRSGPVKNELPWRPWLVNYNYNKWSWQPYKAVIRIGNFFVCSELSRYSKKIFLKK
jgi:hypothetical protein